MSEIDIQLIHDALRFFVWGAGEGLSPPREDNTPEPETTLFEYTVVTGDEDWEGVPDRIVAALRANKATLDD